MTSIDQAFVKAYARRNQPTRAPQEADPSSADDGSLPLNRSAAASARSWVDGADAGRRRHDPPETTHPKPHLENASGGVRTPSAAPEISSAPPAASEPASGFSDNGGTFYAHATLAPELAQLYAEPPMVPAPLRIDPPAGDRPPQPAAAEVSTAPAPAEPAPLAESPATESAATESAGQPSVRSPRPFRAVWEVDHLEAPESVARLFLNSSLFDQIGDQIGSAARDGLRSILVTSVRSGEGRSTAAVGTALAAASTGLAVALVDADARQPTLADDLRLDLEYGWLDALRGDLPIEEISVHSLDDRLTLVPLMPPPGNTAATAAEIDSLVQQLRSHFDLVVLDGSPADGANPATQLTAIDTALVVRDMTRTSGAEVQQTAAGLRVSGVQGIGVIENFS